MIYLLHQIQAGNDLKDIVCSQNPFDVVRFAMPHKTMYLCCVCGERVVVSLFEKPFAVSHTASGYLPGTPSVDQHKVDGQKTDKCVRIIHQRIVEHPFVC